MLAEFVSLGKEVGKQKVSDVHGSPLREFGKEVYERNKVREEVVDLQAEMKESKVQKFAVWEKPTAFRSQTVRVSLKFKRLSDTKAQ